MRATLKSKLLSKNAAPGAAWEECAAAAPAAWIACLCAFVTDHDQAPGLPCSGQLQPLDACRLSNASPAKNKLDWPAASRWTVLAPMSAAGVEISN
jgi:hypothetical protein